MKNEMNFVQVLEVKAVDGDRGIANDIKYSITGGPEHLFGINGDTGLVYSKVSSNAVCEDDYSCTCRP